MTSERRKGREEGREEGSSRWLLLSLVIDYVILRNFPLELVDLCI